ncbi:MAG: efflux RND transporter permease subunit, partial [Candidatus Eremiobacteraeota bacterium]|nr:efflux RND transporter permease subunit [Candidatus Eremiobacteraeota bacterium]
MIVFANYPGASPQEMERLVVKPIEDQLNGIDHVDQMSASAQEGAASIVVQFKLGTDLSIAAVNVQSAVDTARVYLPTDLDPPTVYKSGAGQPLMQLAVNSSTLSAPQLADVVNNRLEPMIKAIPDIQSVDVEGALDREFHVEPIPERLDGTMATLSDVFSAVAANNSNLPGGILRQPTQETSVSVHAEVNTAQDLLGIPLPVPGNSNKNLRIGDVAYATDSHVEPTSISHYNGQPQITMMLYRAVTADEIKTTATTREQLKKIEAQFPQLSFNEVFASGDYTQKELDGVWQSLIEGIILTSLVVLLFLHMWRNMVVVMISIPTSILSTFVMMNLLGFHYDVMSLMGLSLIIGILVDDSIVVLENITRHRDLGEAPVDAAINGRSEIGGAAVAITMVDVVVFAPIAFMSGIVGAWLREFGAVIVVATLFSLFVSFTLTPLLAAKWSVLERSIAPPQWLKAFDSWRTYAVGLAISAVCYFVPWPIKELSEVIPIMIVAVMLLNSLTQRYDAILNWYHRVALPFALEHGLFVVFLCTLLVMNAFTIAGGAGAATVTVNVLFLILAAIWHGVGWILRRRVKPEALEYRWAQSRNGHSRVGRIFEMLGDLRRNAGRVWLRWFYDVGGGGRMLTAITFALPAVVAIAVVALGPIDFDFVPATQTGEINMTVSY